MTSTSKNPSPESPGPEVRGQAGVSGRQEIPVDAGQAFEQFAKPLESFLIGILKNGAEANDALQATFVKLIEKGDTIVQESALKGWLFRVAYNEAMLIKRKDGVKRKHTEKFAWQVSPNVDPSQPVDRMLDDEKQQEIKQALHQLSAAQQDVVRRRIYEGLKFREIADQLDLPLGTVLARMHSSLKKLKNVLKDEA